MTRGASLGKRKSLDRRSRSASRVRSRTHRRNHVFSHEVGRRAAKSLREMPEASERNVASLRMTDITWEGTGAASSSRAKKVPRRSMRLPPASSAAEIMPFQSKSRRARINSARSQIHPNESQKCFAPWAARINSISSGQ